MLGLPRRLVVDEDVLAEHYYTLSRQYHPDFHQGLSAPERLLSLQRSAAVNDAYTCLGDPIARGKWWIERMGEKLGDDMNVPPEMAMVVFEAQDEIEDLGRSADESATEKVHARRASVDDMLTSLVARLAANFAEWDKLPDAETDAALTTELKVALAEISYAETLKRDIERALRNASVV